jgi:hypothetical protein
VPNDEHDIIYVNGELQTKKLKKVKCPNKDEEPFIDWQEIVKLKHREREATVKKAKEKAK